MSTREPVLVHAQGPSSTVRRRRSLSAASSRSISVNKRSPSPIVTFTAAPLSPDAKGVKNITRKVIRTLEGLGHLDSADMFEQDYGSDEKHSLSEVEPSLNNGNSDDHHLSRSKSSNGTATHSSSSSVSSQDPTPAPEKKVDWEIPRKLLHSSIGFLTLYLYISEGDVEKIVLVLSASLAVIVPVDILRLRYPRFERIYERYLGFLMRDSEKKSINGVIWYILGVNLALTYYPQDVATVAILILAWADTAASTFGRLLGAKSSRLPPRTPVLRLPLAPRKSYAGFIAATVTGALIAVGFWGWVAPLRNTAVSWWWDGGVRASSTLLPSLGIHGAGLHGGGGWLGLGILGAFAGLVSGVAEALELGSFDDNLTLPIISGGCILGFFKVLGLLSSP